MYLCFKSFQFNVNYGIIYALGKSISQKLICLNTEYARTYIYIDFLHHVPQELFYMLRATFVKIKNNIQCYQTDKLQITYSY